MKYKIDIFGIIFSIAIFLFVFYAGYLALVTYLDATIADECRECNAKFSWCKDYWKEKGLCKDSN